MATGERGQPVKISLGLGRAKKASIPPPRAGQKRPHAALRDEDDQRQDEGSVQEVSHFDRHEGGAYDERKGPNKDVPMVIAPQANRDWKESSKRRRQKSALPGGGGGGAEDAADREELIRGLEDANKPTFGLNVVAGQRSEELQTTNGRDGGPLGVQPQTTPPESSVEISLKNKTDEELAMDALLGIQTTNDLVLPAVDEEQAFQQDYKDAPDQATLQDYDRVPVEQFGAALLRGMGWKDGEGIGNQRGHKLQKAKPLERRPALLGVGAKLEAAVAQEMGTWGRAAKDRKGPSAVYNPVLLRDRETGEMFTEEELEKRKEKAKRSELDVEFEMRERERDSTKEKRHSRDDHDLRNKHEDNDSDDEYRQQKARERRRRERERERDHFEEDDYRRRKEKERRRRDRDREQDEYRQRRDRDSRHGGSREHDSEKSRRYGRDRDRYHERNGR